MILIEMFTSWNCIRWSNMQWTWGVTFPSEFSLLLFSIFLTSVQSFFYLPSEFSYFLSPFFYFPSPFCLLTFTIFFTSFHPFFFTSLHHFSLPFSFLKPFYFPSTLLYFQESYKTVARKRSSQNFPKINILSVCLFSEKFSCFVFLYSSFWYSLFCLITHLLKNKLENLHNPVILEAWREFPDAWKTMITLWLIKDFSDEDAKCTENSKAIKNSNTKV